MKEKYNVYDDEKIVARLITIDRDAKVPILSKNVIKNCTDLNYKSIPVIIIDGYFISNDKCGNSVFIQGNIVTDRALDVITRVHKAVKGIDLSPMKDAAYGFILVYAVNEFMEDFDDPCPLNLIEVSKLKIRFHKFELEGIRYRSKAFIALTDDDEEDDKESKSFVVDTEVD